MREKKGKKSLEEEAVLGRDVNIRIRKELQDGNVKSARLREVHGV